MRRVNPNVNYGLVNTNVSILAHQLTRTTLMQGINTGNLQKWWRVRNSTLTDHPSVEGVQATPQWARLACSLALFWAKGSQSTVDSEKISNTSLTAYKNLDSGPIPGAIARGNFLYLTYLHEGKHLLPNTCSSHVPEICPPLLWSPRAPTPFLRSGWYISLNCLTAFGSHIFVSPPHTKLKFVFLLSICCMLI